jgi:membrane protein YdbS with pleckstrin-like domain
MKCAKCGNKVAYDAAFCSNCGAPAAATADVNDGADTASAGVARARGGARQASGDGSQKPEEELWTGSFSPRAMIGPAIACAVVSVSAIVGGAFVLPDGMGWTLLAIMLVLVWAWLGLTLLYRRLTVRYRLTNYRLFHDTGLFSRTGNRIEVIDVDDVTVHQGLIERLLGVGTVHIASSDHTDPSLDLPGIDDVRNVADLIDSTRRAERQRRGLHLETI